MVRPLFTRLLRLRLWVTERMRPGEAQITLFWAGLVGILGGLSTQLFRAACDLVQWTFTGRVGSLVETSQALPAWHRMLVPAIGGLAAGLVLHFGVRFARGRTAPDYMEAVVIGDGVVRSRPTLVRVVSSTFSIGSGGSIGREGPMVQLSAMLASLVGRRTNLSRPRLRLLVACGAAAGIAAAYNAPIGGALFVAEIVLGSIAMETFGPLILASVLATVTARFFHGGSPLFEIPQFQLQSVFELPAYLVLGLIAGALAPPFLKLLDRAAALFAKVPGPIFARLGLGGLAVGAISIVMPEVWGNGYNSLSSLLTSTFTWGMLLALLVAKLAATAATVGSGAVGGIFTPTLLVGAILGGLFGLPLHALAPSWTGPEGAYALVGMGAFLAATTHAPLMAILILFEMTLDYDIVLPLMLACVSAYFAAKSVSTASLYERIATERTNSNRPAVDRLRVRDLMRLDPPCVTESARYEEIVQVFVGHPYHNLYVVGPEHEFRGAIPLHEIKPFLNDPELGKVAIAQDLLREDFPTVTPDTTLRATLDAFAKHAGERLPVVEPNEGRRLVGSISKTDLLLSIAPGKTDA